ncbi:MAG: hypothetical protein ACRDV0_01365 [Acidimicrobiales bacterium]
MKVVRYVAVVVILAALATAAGRAGSTSAAAPSPSPCTVAALSVPFTGFFALGSIDHFGCEGDWAYTWATVGTGETAIGVTEVLEWSPVTDVWSFAKRADVCVAGRLPPTVYRLGCFSN